MVKITLITNNPREVDIVPETMTIREFLESHDVNYGIGSTSLDGVTINTEGLDKSFLAHHVTERAIVTCLANKDNGAQAIVMGSSCVVKSALTPEQIERIKKFHPDALKMYDENDELAFRIDINQATPGSINEYGVCFGSGKSSDGKATVTVLLDPQVENPAELVYEKLGRALMYLKEMESQLEEAMPEMTAEENEIRRMITTI